MFIYLYVDSDKYYRSINEITTFKVLEYGEVIVSSIRVPLLPR